MTLDTTTYLEAIAEHSAGLADAANDGLDKPTEHCPGWSMADLVCHLTEVQWFWATVVEQKLQERPEGAGPGVVAKAELVTRFLEGARHLVRVLSASDQGTEVYTWASQQRDVASVTRHQVQEVVVPHWDAAHATRRAFEVEPALAADSIEEFLTFSVSSVADPIDPPRAAFDGALGLRCTDIDRSWSIRDGSIASTVRFERGADSDGPQFAATASELLLWLYSRIELESDDRSVELGRRLHDLSFTD